MITINALDVAGDPETIEIPNNFKSITIMESAQDMDTTPFYIFIIHFQGADDKAVYFRTKQEADVEKIRIEGLRE